MTTKEMSDFLNSLWCWARCTEEEQRKLSEIADYLDSLGNEKNDLEVLRDTLVGRDILVGFKQGVDSIRALSSVTPQESRWIPVSERLPEAGEYIGDVERYYLVQNEYGDMLVARYTHSGYWEQIYQLKPIGDEIVAWMPLPILYEPQESEEQEDGKTD